jgi:hypothetical protein
MKIPKLSLILIVLLGLLMACVPPEQPDKQREGACPSGFFLNNKTRLCEPNPVPPPPEAPKPTLKTVQFQEDTAKTVTLTYTDKEGDFATSCAVSGVSSSLTASGPCSCLGGVCTVSLTPISNYPFGATVGVQEFTYTLTDRHGTSATQLVQVSVNQVDDAPIAGPLPLTVSTFDEDTVSSNIVLSYSDAEDQKAQRCEVILDVSNTAGVIHTPCSCTSAGVCSFKLTGKQDANTGFGVESYSYRVEAGGVWSEYLTSNTYQINAVTDPIVFVAPSGATPLNALTIPTINEDRNTDFVVTIPYYAADEVAANNCSIASELNVDEINCSCGPPVDSNKHGSCDLTLHLDFPAADDLNSVVPTEFSFKYQVEDPTSLTDLPIAGSDKVSLTVQAVNDLPTVVGAPGAQAGTEDTAINVSFALDEGGASDENAQSVLVKAYSDDTTGILPNSAITIRYDTTTLGTGSTSTFYDLGDGTTSANTKNVNLVLTPTANRFKATNTIITVEFKDSLGANGTTFTFTVTFADSADVPEITVAQQVCNYDSYLQGGASNGCSLNGCLSNSTPVGSITPTKTNLIFYNYVTDQCFRSNGLTNNHWEIFSTACPITKSTVETSCLTLNNPTNNSPNCLGSGTPLGVLTPVQSGSYYYDYASKICYVSTGTGSNTAWNTFTPTSLSESYTCPYTQTGSSSPLNSVTPSGAESIYYASTTEKCYYANGTTSSAWVEFKTRCPVTPKASLTSCPKVTCMGTKNPRSNTDPADNIVPTAVGQYYYERDEGICYKSIGTSSDPARSKYNWVIEGRGIKDLKGNKLSEESEGGIFLKNLMVDEGGGATNKKLTFKLTNLSRSDSTNNPGNKDLFSISHTPAAGTFNGDLYLNGVKETGVSSSDGAIKTWTEVMGDGVDSALERVYLRFYPTAGKFGRSEFKLEIIDNSAGELTLTEYFSILVHPVVAQFDEWLEVVAVGDKVDGENRELEKRSIKLRWDAFNIQGEADNNVITSGAPLNPSVASYEQVGISGFNVYRRMTDEEFNFDYPLNGSTPIASNVFTFTDSESTTNKIPGPPLEGRVYYYRVVPLDNTTNILPIFPADTQAKLRVIAPPDNMSFVPRFLVNKDICTQMHSESIDSSENNRCRYRGPGEKEVDEQFYYDIGYDLLVDRYEAGCDYNALSDTNQCSGGRCLGTDNPTLSVDGMIHYNRSTGVCRFRNSDGNTENLDKVTAGKFSTYFNSSRNALLPPLTNLSQEDAEKVCNSRSTLTINTSPSSTETLTNFRLPSRKEQIAYSSWPDTTFTGLSNTDLDAIETGLNLNASSKCNGSGASGIDQNFSNAAIPLQEYTVAGTQSSNIRSLHTGSTFTKDCSSRYGVQDAIGNVKEWVEDRIYCYNQPELGQPAGSNTLTNTKFHHICQGVAHHNPVIERKDNVTPTPGTHTYINSGVPCPFTRREEIDWDNGNQDNDFCNQNSHCAGNIRPINNITPGRLGVVFHDTSTNRCWISAGPENHQWVNFAQTGDEVECPYTKENDDVLLSNSSSTNVCDTDDDCIGGVDPATLITPGKSGIIFQRTGHTCYVSNGPLIANWTTYQDDTTASINCPVTSSAVEPNCKGDGTTYTYSASCSRNHAPIDADMRPTKANSYFYNIAANLCYRSRFDQPTGQYTWSAITATTASDYPTDQNVIPHLNTLAGSSKTDMLVDDAFYPQFRLDGILGPCVDADANGYCDDSQITSWLFEDESFGGGLFFLPMGLPAQSDFKSNFPDSKVVSYSTSDDFDSLLEIGPNSGITVEELRGDLFSVNSKNLEEDFGTLAANRNCGAMATGGGYNSGSRAGRYSAEFLPCRIADNAVTFPSTSKTYSPEIGFRCVIPVDDAQYDE